jgi:3-methyladenine DNA glycosylase AlkD
MPRMARPKSLLSVERQLARAGSAERRRVATWYFPTALRVHGTPVAELRRIARDLARSVSDSPGKEVVAMTVALARRGSFEARAVAYEVLAMHRSAAEALTLRDVEQLGRGMDNWGVVDAYSVLVSGPAWRRGLVSDGAIAKWSRSKDRWWRRAALASTVALNMRSRGGEGDVPRTLAVCTRLAADHDDMVEKALSWALRAAIQHDRAAVAGFLDTHDGVLGRRVVREVSTKLRTGKKNAPRKHRPR